MLSEKDLLLAVHMAKENEDIYLDHNRQVTVLRGGVAAMSFYLPKNRTDSLGQLFSSVIDENNSEENYAIYLSDGKEIRENDKTKVMVLRNQIVKLTWDEFISSYQSAFVNAETVEKLSDKFDCVFANDLEKLISYSKHGITFTGDINARLFSFDEMMDLNYQADGELLLPIAEYEGSIICYQCSSRFFVRLENGEIKNKSTNLDEVVIDAAREIDESILNIEEQLEKLSIGTIKKIDLPDEDGIEMIAKTIEVDGTEVNVKISDDVSFDMSALIELVDIKIDEMFQAQKDKEKENVAKIKTKLDQMTQKNEEAKAKIKEREQAKKSFRLDIVSSLKNSAKNYAFNLNETAKLVVSHLPYYEIGDGLGIIKVPALELTDHSVIEGNNIDLGRINLKTVSIDSKKAVFEVVKAPLVVDMQGTGLKRGNKIEFLFDKEKAYRINKSGAMETWSMSLEKASFTRELRNTEYGRLMKLMKDTETYQKYSEIEKYETKNSVMLFLYFVMNNNDEAKKVELERIIKTNESLYEEFISKYNLEKAMQEKDLLSSFRDKEKFIEKANFVRGLIDSNWVYYPRYIFGQHRYFERDALMEEYINYRNDSLSLDAFKIYLEKLFAQYNLYSKLKGEGKENLDACLNYLSKVFKNNPVYGETVKYEIEKHILIDESEEELSLLISKICRRGIDDYNDFKEYEYEVQELYRKGELKYPIFSDKFELDSIKGEI